LETILNKAIAFSSSIPRLFPINLTTQLTVSREASSKLLEETNIEIIPLLSTITFGNIK